MKILFTLKIRNSLSKRKKNTIPFSTIIKFGIHSLVYLRYHDRKPLFAIVSGFFPFFLTAHSSARNWRCATDSSTRNAAQCVIAEAARYISRANDNGNDIQNACIIAAKISIDTVSDASADTAQFVARQTWTANK